MSALHTRREALINGLAATSVHLMSHGFHSRTNYGFTSYKESGNVKINADMAFFDSPIPSIDSATLGIFYDESFNGDSERIMDFSYLGAPLILIDNSQKVTLFKFEGIGDYHIVEEIRSENFSSSWQRLNLDSYISDNRGSLQFERSKNLIIQAAKSALLDRMNALLMIIIDEGVYPPEDSFEVAMLSIRFLSLGDNSTAFSASSNDKIVYSKQIAERIQGITSFDNLPPESIAELYEAFAVTKDLRKKNGIVYTPAWLAKYLVARMPEAFTGLKKALDPACGSGTFLVAYLERFLLEQSRRGHTYDLNGLYKIISGCDIDPVAVELTKLTLDYLSKSLNAPMQSWSIHCLDSTANVPNADWIIGNLPFGYRSYAGKDDISNRIAQKVFEANSELSGLCLIFPESLAYNRHSKATRSLLRQNIQIEELIKLPENTFDTASARTLAVIGRAGMTSLEVLVRDVSEEDIYKFQMNLYSSKSYISRFPEDLEENWVFSPFNNLIGKASTKGMTLSQISEVMVGMQIYGKESDAKRAGQDSKHFLEDPTKFINWNQKSLSNLPRINTDRNNFRRTGPWNKCDQPKIIVRSTTYPENDGRLSAVPDEQGIWFSDKFTGIWLTALAYEQGISIQSLASYFQSRFARVWFSVNNPSRKLRTSTLKRMPIPKLPKSVWQRSESLSKTNHVVGPRKKKAGPLFSDSNYSSSTDWEWFNAAIEASFNIDATDSIAMSKWLEKMK